MDQFLIDLKVPLKYSPLTRSYGILLKYSAAAQMIAFCPWCGTKLPKRLSDEYHDILEKEYGVIPDLDVQADPNIPIEFKSDLWWKKRGL